MSLLSNGTQSRVLSRYRIMFRASTMAFGAAVLLIGLGFLTLIFAADASVLGAGLLLAAMSGLSGYKITVSTMRIIDRDSEGIWRNAGL